MIANHERLQEIADTCRENAPKLEAVFGTDMIKKLNDAAESSGIQKIIDLKDDEVKLVKECVEPITEAIAEISKMYEAELEASRLVTGNK